MPMLAIEAMVAAMARSHWRIALQLGAAGRD
jgi:hypothetical protein